MCFVLLDLHLQRKVYKQYTEVPDVLEGVLDKETFEKARVYQLDKSSFGFWYGLFSQVESTVSSFVSDL